VTAGFDTNLLTGIAVAFNAAAIGTWNTTGVYTATQTGIVLGNIPSTPDRIIALTTYAVSDAVMADSVTGLQVRTRWGGADKRLVDDLDDVIFAYLHAKTNWTLSTGIVVVQCLRNSAATLGQDTNNRWSNVANYYLDTYRPATNRI